MNLKKEAKIQEKINKQMEKSLKEIMKKYGGVPMDENFSKFVADVYITGATDAIENIQEGNKK